MLLDRRNLFVKAGNNQSLTQKRIGPYQVIKTVGSHTYKLQLPSGMRIHHVLYTTMMKPYQGNHQNANHQDADQDDEQDELFYNVESILASKHIGRKVKYRVQWEGYTE